MAQWLGRSSKVEKNNVQMAKGMWTRAQDHGQLANT